VIQAVDHVSNKVYSQRTKRGKRKLCKREKRKMTQQFLLEEGEIKADKN